MRWGRIMKLQALDRRILAIAIPATLGYITTPLIGIVDTAIVARLDDLKLIAGLALGAIIIDVVMTTMNFLRSGTTGLVAQAYGRGEQQDVQAIFWRAICVAISFGLLIIIASTIIVQLGIAAMGAENGTAMAMASYLDIRLLGSPAALMNYVILGTLFGLGRSGWALITQLIINLLNIALSVKWGLWDGLGLEGVAMGTVAAEAVGAVFGFIIVGKVVGIHRNLSAHAIFQWPAFKNLIQINSDIMIRSFALLMAFAMFARFGASMGTEILALNAILLHFFLLSGYFLDGLATAAEQMAGYAKGKADQQMFTKATNRALLWAVAIALCIALSFWLIYPLALKGLTTNLQLQAQAESYILWAIITPITGLLAFHFDGVYIGATWTRDMRRTMLIALACYLLAAFALSHAFGNHGLWLALNLFLLLRGLLLWLSLPKNMQNSFPH